MAVCSGVPDYFIIFNEFSEEHVRHKRTVLNSLKAAGVSLNLKNCVLFEENFDYLGNVVRNGKL